MLAGLSSSGYTPDDNEHVGYTTLALPPDTGGARSRRMSGSTASCRRKRERSALRSWCSGWIRTIFETPRSIASPKSSTSLRPWSRGSSRSPNVILGPADSDGLRAMSSELEQGGCDSLSRSGRPIPIYSPPRDGGRLVGSSATRSRTDIPTPNPTLGPTTFNDRCEHVHLYRTVASDLAVLKSLYGELQYRGIRSVGEIALITER